MTYEIEIGPSEERRMVVQSAWDSEAYGAWAEGGFDELVLNYARGFTGDISFLQSIDVESITLIARDIIDATPIYSVGETLLRANLAIQPDVAIDLSRLPRLKALSIENWRQVASSIHAAPKLQDLYIGRYTDRDLRPLAGFVDLKRVRLKDRPTLSSLDGAGDIVNLRELQVVGAYKLRDFRALSQVSVQLEKLWLESCKALSDLDFASRLDSIEDLTVADCGSIDSLAPIRGKRDLRGVFMWESTNIADGDLLPLATLPNLRALRMMNRRHYHPTVGEIQETLGAPRP